MPKLHPDIASRVLDLLHGRTMLQTDITDQFPQDRYLDVKLTLQAMERDGSIVRNRHGATYRVRANTDAGVKS